MLHLPLPAPGVAHDDAPTRHLRSHVPASGNLDGSKHSQHAPSLFCICIRASYRVHGSQPARLRHVCDECQQLALSVTTLALASALIAAFVSHAITEPACNQQR
jgi:hypothetical protein